MRLRATLCCLVLLAGCDSPVAAPAPPPHALLWSNADSVFALDGDQPHRLGTFVIGTVGWSADGRTAAAIIAEDRERPSDLVVWSAGAPERRTGCAGCNGAVITGDEVRTAVESGIRRFALSDLAPRATIDSTPPMPSEVLEFPDPVDRDTYPVVVAATPERTTLSHLVTAYPVLLAYVYAVDESGAVVWRHDVDGDVPPRDLQADATATRLAFSQGRSQGDCGFESETVVLDLASGAAVVWPSEELPGMNTELLDLWWNGPDLVATHGSHADAGEGCGGMRYSTSLLSGGQWQKVGKTDQYYLLRVLPSGARVALDVVDGLTITENGTRRVLADHGSAVWTPTLREPVRLP
ncbi:hypothetical protein [Actinokineospora sp. NBRC 105648]|uniref:hypothetical protein n=1 Tax=Actinokineospora sp. NBRC 105648 TaxID=3032206 RepID=UPI0024A38B79|nr:hypothetical protein [Actinokineospora sp. NBRC 105648]GLZ38929.1 hypothetical protein Acsp05_25530 [Actinokineospora sp. NBRC 105648]